jgi:hypothetical protein
VNWIYSFSDKDAGHSDAGVDYLSDFRDLHVSSAASGADDIKRDASTRVPHTPPPIRHQSDIISPSQMTELRLVLPIIVQFEAWVQLYSVLRNGADLVSFFELSHGAEYSLILVQTEHGDVFGGFAASEWSLSKDFCKSLVA